jgi:hypothetical protein
VVRRLKDFCDLSGPCVKRVFLQRKEGNPTAESPFGDFAFSGSTTKGVKGDSFVHVGMGDDTKFIPSRYVDATIRGDAPCNFLEGFVPAVLFGGKSPEACPKAFTGPLIQKGSLFGQNDRSNGTNLNDALSLAGHGPEGLVAFAVSQAFIGKGTFSAQRNTGAAN